MVKKYKEISVQSPSSSLKMEKKENRMAVHGVVETRKFSNFVDVIARFIGFGWFINIAIAFIESFVRQLSRGSIRKQRKNGNAQSSSSSVVVREFSCKEVEKVTVPQSRFPDHETYEDGRVKPLNATKLWDMFGYTLVISQAPLSSETFVYVKILHQSDIGVLVVAVEFGELVDDLGTEDKTKAWQWFPMKADDPPFSHEDPNDKNKKLKVTLLAVIPLVGKPIEETTKENQKPPPPKPFSLIQYTVEIDDGTSTKVIHVLHLSGFDNNNFKLDAMDVRTLSLTVVRIRDLQRDAKDNERGVWFHSLAGKERSPIVATLFMMWQMILKMDCVNVEEIMNRVRRYRLGAFCLLGVSPHGKTSLENMNHIWWLLHDIAKQMFHWRRAHKFTMNLVSDVVCYQVFGPADEMDVSKVLASCRGGTSSIKLKSMLKSVSESTIAKSVGKSDKSDV